MMTESLEKLELVSDSDPAHAILKKNVECLRQLETGKDFSFMVRMGGFIPGPNPDGETTNTPRERQLRTITKALIFSTFLFSILSVKTAMASCNSHPPDSLLGKGTICLKDYGPPYKIVKAKVLDVVEGYQYGKPIYRMNRAVFQGLNGDPAKIGVRPSFMTTYFGFDALRPILGPDGNVMKMNAPGSFITNCFFKTPAGSYGAISYLTNHCTKLHLYLTQLSFNGSKVRIFQATYPKK